MSNQDETGIEGKSVGRLVGKTTIYSATLLITDPKVSKSNYFVIYGDKDEEGKNEYYILSILDIWKDAKGLMANLKVLGERPERPFDVGKEVYLATDAQIVKLLGIDNPPEKSVSIGTLLSYPFNVNVLVKNIGRLFITGKSGSGKSYTMGVLCEELLKKGLPFVIVDRHGEYGSLKVASEDFEVKELEIEKEKVGYCPWCGESIPTDAKSCEHCGKELEPEILAPKENEPTEIKLVKPKKTSGAQESEYVDNIIEFADLNVNKGGDVDLEYLFSLSETDIVAPRLCTIINLRGLDLEIQELIAGKLLKKLYNASVARKIPPFYLFLDEAHLFAGKKQTETCDAVKLFAQEGRKFGANIVIGTQRPQLLDTTIRAQSGTWIVHNLTDVRDIDITISSAEDLSKENKDDISGLEPGQAIICGEAVKGIPLFIQVRKRRTKHGGTGFNPLDFLSEQTVEESQKRKQRILSGKSADELQAGKTIYQEMMQPKAATDYLDEISALKVKIKELESEVDVLKQKCSELEQSKGVVGKAIPVNDKIKELETQVKVWQEKYNYLKDTAGKAQAVPKAAPKEIVDKSETVLNLQNKIIELEAEIKKYKIKYTEAMLLAEKSIAELKKKK